MSRLFSILFCCILLLFGISEAKAQMTEYNGLSNLRVKKLAVGKKDTLTIDSLSLVSGTLFISDVNKENYLVQPTQSRIVWLHRPATDSVLVHYRVLPIAFNHRYLHKSTKAVDSNYAFLIYRQYESNGKKNFVDFNPIDYSGSYGRSMQMGNNQDVVLNSHFNLQVNGYLLDSIKLEAALTDNTIPFQPEGNTQSLQEFDQIYIHLRKNKHDLLLGDFSLEKPPGYFLNFYKRVQGIFYQDEFRLNRTSTNKIGLSGSVAKGQFARNIFPGLEGNQGPYKLTGNSGEQFFIVLAGTEKVFINDKPMERGENADYTINYNTGEIRFMARQMITKDSRIQVEFEYQDKNYLNSLIYAYDELQVGKKWNVRINAYSNQDAKNQPYLQTLSGQQKQFLSTIGDSIQNAFDTIIKPDTFAANKVLYELKDTTIGSLRYDSVLVYSTNPNAALYAANFSYVGDGKGNYIISRSDANGRVYDWVPPVNGHPVGNYAPVQLLITPKMTQVFTINSTYKIDSFKSVNVEVGASNVDPNLFSKIDNNTHWGLASRVTYNEQRFMGHKDSNARTTWNLQNAASVEYVQSRFQSIAPYRNVEFARDWNVPQSAIKPDEYLAALGSKLRHQHLGEVAYNFGYYERDATYKGYRNVVGYTLTNKRFNGGANVNLLHATDTFQRSVYMRPSAFAEYRFPRIFNTALGVKYDAENNALKDKFTDSLRSNAFAFNRTGIYLQTPGGQPVQYGIEYNLRHDLLPRNNEFRQQSHSHNVDLRMGISKWKNHVINFTGTYRQLVIDDTTFNNQKSEASLLGRLSYNGSFWQQALSLNTLYEFGSGQEQKRAYTYVEVPAGQGIYMWNDYNGDGVQQTNEFEIALYPDQKKFIRVFTPTNEYIKVNYVNFNQSISFEPSYLWSGKTVKGWKKFAGRFSDQAAVQINNRLLSDFGLKAFDPLVSTQNSDDIITTVTSINNTIYFNRLSAIWGIDYNYLLNVGKQLLTYGVEGNTTAQHLAKIRTNLSRSWTFTLTGKDGWRGYKSALQDNRTYHVDFLSAEPALTWLYRSVWRITTSLKYDNRKNQQYYGDNQEHYGGETANISSASFELRWSQPTLGSVQIRGTYSGIQFDGLPTSPVSFIMIDGLQKGDNYLWNLNWQRRVGKGIEISLEYDGRKPGTANIIHTGRMSIKAVL